MTLSRWQKHVVMSKKCCLKVILKLKCAVDCPQILCEGDLKFFLNFCFFKFILLFFLCVLFWFLLLSEMCQINCFLFCNCAFFTRMLCARIRTRVFCTSTRMSCHCTRNTITEPFSLTLVCLYPSKCFACFFTRK